MAFIGAFTALFAATIAVAQNDIKRVLAYSTISQLGYMIAALGHWRLCGSGFPPGDARLLQGAPLPGFRFGDPRHGARRACTPASISIRRICSTWAGLRKKMPITFWTFLIGGLALSGFPLVTAGFWSKDEILAEAFAHMLLGSYSFVWRWRPC